MKMTFDDALAILAIVCILNNKKRKRRNLRCKRCLLKRSEYSHTNLLKELRITPKYFNNYLRMNEDTFFL